MIGKLSSVSTIVIGIGGAGGNIVKDIMDCGPVHVINTVAKELPPERDNLRTYVVGNGEGKGGDRRRNRGETLDPMLKIIDNIDLDGKAVILCGSGSGGTASGSMPFVHAHLVKKGVPTLSVLITDARDREQAAGSLNTFKTYLGLAQKSGDKYSVSEYSNLHDSTAVVNDKAVTMIRTIACLTSADTENIDFGDVKLFLNPGLYSASSEVVASSIQIVMAANLSNESETEEIVNLLPSMARFIGPDDNRPNIDFQALTHGGKQGISPAVENHMAALSMAGMANTKIAKLQEALDKFSILELEKEEEINLDDL